MSCQADWPKCRNRGTRTKETKASTCIRLVLIEIRHFFLQIWQAIKSKGKASKKDQSLRRLGSLILYWVAYKLVTCPFTGSRQIKAGHARKVTMRVCIRWCARYCMSSDMYSYVPSAFCFAWHYHHQPFLALLQCSKTLHNHSVEWISSYLA